MIMCWNTAMWDEEMNLVDMHRAEEPVLVFACRAEFLEICIESRHAHGLLVLEPEETFYLHRRLVGDYNINFVAELLEILRALGQFRFGRYLVARPGVEIGADIYIRLSPPPMAKTLTPSKS